MEERDIMANGQDASETSENYSDVVATITLTPKVDRSSLDDLTRRVREAQHHLEEASRLLDGIGDCEVTVQVLLSKG